MGAASEETVRTGGDGQRIVVTGIGLLTPCGGDRRSSWRGIRDGAHCLRRLAPHEIASPEGVPAAAETWAGAPVPGVDRSAGEPVVPMALRAAEEALQDATLSLESVDPPRVGCVLGVSKPGRISFGRAPREGPDSAVPWGPAHWPHAASTVLAERFDIRGPVLAPVAACATGLAALIRGAALIRDGLCDVVLAGSADAGLQLPLLASYRRLGVLSRGAHDAPHACRPFDRRRDGFLIGEGAAVLVLERREHALQRGAVPWAEWLADGLAADPHGMTGVDVSGVPLARLIGDVLRRAGRMPQDVDYVNLHGTATRTNDLAETRALHHVLGACAPRVACSSIKGSVGHLLGAAGSVETAITAVAIRTGIVPPTLNRTAPDPECDLDYTPLAARSLRVRTAVKVSLGFGGHLAAAVLGAPE